MGSTIIKWTAKMLFALAGMVIVFALRMLARLAWWLTRQAVAHPRSTLGVIVAGAAVFGLGWQTVVIALGCVFVAASTWRAAHRESFDRWLGTWVRTWWRRWWHYRRQWAAVMGRCGLVVEHRDEEHVPVIRKIATTPYWDRISLKMQVGQELDDYRLAAERLRHAFGAERISVREVVPGGVGLDLMRRDPFRTVKVPAVPMPARLEDVDYTALPIGLTEFLTPYCVSVVGGHMVFAGASGAGKAGGPWGVLRALAPAIGAGLVVPAGIDPKGKELRQGISLFNPGVFGTKYAEKRGDPDPGLEPTGDYAVTCRDTVALLKRLVAELEDRNEKAGAAGGERDFTPSVERPLRLIVIDELAPLLAYWPRSKRDAIEDSLGLLLTQGRAEGYIVVGAIQEPTKDIFHNRDLFARRVALRLPTEDHVDAALTDHAVKRGARCHEIPESLPGVLYQHLEGEGGMTRARLGHVTDDDIAELVAAVTRHSEVVRFTARRDDAAVAVDAA